MSTNSKPRTNTPPANPGAMPSSYPEYLTRKEVIEGVMSGKYVFGEMNMNKKFSSNIAFVRNATLWNNIDVCIEGKLDRNRALEKDIVVVQINPRDKWKPKTGSGVTLSGECPKVASVNIASREADLSKPHNERSRLPDNERVVCRALEKIQRLKKCEADPLADAPKPELPDNVMITGKVVHIWKSGHQTHHSAKAMQGAKGKKFMRFVSYDERVPHIEVVADRLPAPVRDNPEEFLVYLKMTGWPSNKTFPQGELVRTLGSASQVKDQTNAILYEHGVDYTDEFSDDCLADIPDTIPIDEILQKDRNRRDMRIGSKHERFVVSIDPATARDLDDALSCEPLGGGNYRVGVHIADVSAFVPFGSALDEEARKRATSVYLVQKVIPMLPRKLCEEHCSLNTLGDKLAFTVEWTMDSRGRILKEWMGQTVIRNQCKMAYENAQDIIDGKFDPSCLDLSHMPASDHEWAIDKIKDAVKGLHAIAANIRQERFDRGALTMNQAKMYFEFEDKDSNMAPKGWHLHETAEANWLVEEFMVMANARVTEKTIEFCPDNALARWHESPDYSRFKTLTSALDKKGEELKVTSGKALADSLARLRSHKDGATIRALAIRCMKLAKYCCTVESADHSLSHFALNLPLYTHFTSPIRRYADLVVHRVLKCALEIEGMVNQSIREGIPEDEISISPKAVPSGELLLHESDVTDIAVHCNERKDAARKCSEKSTELYFCLYLQSLHEKNKVDGTVSRIEKHRAALTKVADKSFQIFLPTIGCERELFHNNGQNDQLWIGTNKCNSKEGVMYIQWEEGLYQEVSMLDGWDVNVFLKPGQKLDFVTELQPPPRSELLTEAQVLSALDN